MTISKTAIDDVEVVAAAAAELGEGPVWDGRIGRLVWVDIMGRALHRTDPATGVTETSVLPSHVGAVAPRASGGYVAALVDGFWEVGDGPPRSIVEVGDPADGQRFNDGKCDPAGRFWAGTIAYDESPGTSGLYRLDTSGQVTKMLDGVSISNGLAWSGDGATMYYIDTPTRRIDAFSFDVVTGAIENRRLVVEVADGAGYPDGMTIDEEGGLWVALWGGAAVHRYVEGELDHVVEVPVDQPTSCTFGGDALDELYITSAWRSLSDEARHEQPLAGAVFRCRPGVRGRAPVAFAG